MLLMAVAVGGWQQARLGERDWLGCVVTALREPEGEAADVGG